MVEQRGGYRKPANPAPSSGPGALSQRTDGGPAQGAKYMSGMPYGENTMEQQTAAPMSGGAPIPTMPVMEMPTPLMAPSSRPDEPITAGIDRGEGVGAEAMFDRPSSPTKTLTETLRDLIRFDPTGDTELIYRALIDEGY